jgi:hypothetical protein
MLFQSPLHRGTVFKCDDVGIPWIQSPEGTNEHPRVVPSL